MVHVLHGIARRLQIPVLIENHSRLWILGLFALVNGVVSIGLMAAAALAPARRSSFPRSARPRSCSSTRRRSRRRHRATPSAGT
jgi:hypothetical protein